VAQVGLDGDERELELRLKVVCDAALLGFPNAGKSSLLRRISNARPKVADYPFTTLQPHLGTVDGGDGRQLTVADVPGLLEGASQGVGLGHEFLAHLERARALLHVVAVDSDEDDPLAGCRTRFAAIHHELHEHGAGLAERPQVVLLNKLDLLPPEAAEALVAGFRSAVADGNGLADAAVLRRPGGDPIVLGLSCATGQGVDELRGTLFEVLVDLLPAEVAIAAPDEDGELADYLVYQPRGRRRRTWRILRDDGVLRVAGRELEGLVAGLDLDSAEAQTRLAGELDRIGLTDALRRAGARAGDDVAIGEAVLEFQPPEAPEPPVGWGDGDWSDDDDDPDTATDAP